MYRTLSFLALTAKLMTQLGAKTVLYNTYYKLSELFIFCLSNYFGIKQKGIGFKTL